MLFTLRENHQELYSAESRIQLMCYLDTTVWQTIGCRYSPFSLPSNPLSVYLICQVWLCIWGESHRKTGFVGVWEPLELVEAYVYAGAGVEGGRSGVLWLCGSGVGEVNPYLV